MTLPVTGPALLPLGIVFGFAFGWLLQRARIADTNVIVAQLRLRDYTLFKVMLTAIIVGGVGIFFLHSGGLAAYHVKPGISPRLRSAPYYSASAWRSTAIARAPG